MNPDDLVQMAEFGKQVYEALPDDAKKELLIPPSKAMGRGLGSFLDVLAYPANNWALTLNHKLLKKAKLLEEELTPKINELQATGMYTDEKVGLAVKAIEASKYQLDSDLLRSYFAELITNSLNSEKVDKISPNFASILGNLSEEEALFLHKLRKENCNSLPATDITFPFSSGGVVTKAYGLVIWSNMEIEELGFSIDSLSSFGLVKYPDVSTLTAPENIMKYNSVPSSKIAKELEMVIRSPAYQNAGFLQDIHFVNKSVILTEVGKLFLEFVVV